MVQWQIPGVSCMDHMHVDSCTDKLHIKATQTLDKKLYRVCAEKGVTGPSHQICCGDLLQT